MISPIPNSKLVILNSEVVDKENPIRVLHVNDQTDILKCTKQILEMQKPFQLESASSVEDALERMRKQ